MPLELSSHSCVQSGVLVYSSLDLTQLNSQGGAFLQLWGQRGCWMEAPGGPEPVGPGQWDSPQSGF